jgi:D-serine dehydratase
LILLRSSSYAFHDVGSYLDAENRLQKSNNAVARSLGALKPSLQIVAYVQSIPEPDLAIIGMGNRDVGAGRGFPKPGLWFRVRPGEKSSTWEKCPAEWEVFRVMSQHAFLRIPKTETEPAELKVGDMIAFDVLFPGGTFPSWKKILLVSSDYVVTDVCSTYF